MKINLAIWVVFVFTGVSFQVHADFPEDVPAPAPDLPGSAPSLYPSEQGAFQALEVATQLIETKIAKTGCQAARYPFRVHTIYNGSGTALLGLKQVKLTIALGGWNSINGRWYKITGGGQLGVMTISEIDGQGSFTIGSMMQELSTSWKVATPTTDQPQDFKAVVIRDYYRPDGPMPIPENFYYAGTPISTVIGYGSQQIIMDGYVKAEYWHQSRTWRDDGIGGGTYWLKVRVAPEEQPCAIEVKLAGNGIYPTDNIEGFNEQGYVTVKTATLGAYAPAATVAGSR